jgi:endonuclease/exonuclease/phosphatase family metal-dependent hydrolase
MENSFEKAGTGFGFTYNKFPWAIRIDHQFYDKKLRAVQFQVFSDNKYSDHYPTQSGYILEKK